MNFLESLLPAAGIMPEEYETNSIVRSLRCLPQPAESTPAADDVKQAASVRWNGLSSTFTVDLDVNIRDTFGPASFLVEDATQRVVSLSASGQPISPLTAGGTYCLFSGDSNSLRKQAQTLQGKLHTVRNDLVKLRERHTKLCACFATELAHLRGLLNDGAHEGAKDSAADLMAAQLRLDENLSSSGGVISADSTSAGCCSCDESAAAPAIAQPATAALAAAGTTPAPSTLVSAMPGDEAIRAIPIGELRTCFVEKNGTPRQGCVCPSSKGTLKLRLGARLNAAHSLEGLSAFSHVWLIFIFNKNGNAAAKSKVHPPRLDGEKVGLFSTRTPHRPNPIGLSLVKLDAVRGDTLFLSGIDLVDKTPVIDVKPYVPFADGNALSAPTVAPWLARMPTPDLTVEFTPEAEAQLIALAPSLQLLGSASQARNALAEILAADPRSVHWRQNRTELEYGFSIDSLNVVVRFTEGVATVTQVQLN